jgi:short-subunit dehydrogenase
MAGDERGERPAEVWHGGGGCYNTRAMWPLKERVVVVTGASSGIGRATALAAARAGAQVVIAARREHRLQELAAEIRRLGSHAHIFPLDFSDHAAATYLVEATVVRLNRIDVLVNNAGYGLYARIEDAHPDDNERLFAVNVLSPLAAMRAAVLHMRRQGGGHIVNVASLAAARGVPQMGAYGATKAALVRATESLRVELRGSGVRASVVNPGPVRTEFFEAAEFRGAKPWFGQIGGPFAVSAEYVADVILRCVRTGAADVSIPWYGRLGFVLAPLWPRGSDVAIGLATALRRRGNLDAGKDRLRSLDS